MNFIILLVILTLASARKLENKVPRCDGIIVNGINHEKETLKEYIDKPYMMSIDYDTNVLYYTFTEANGDTFSAAALNLKTKENYEITGVRGGFATSVDPKTHKIYIGGSDGIYEFNYQTKVATNLRITDLSIWQVFAKDGVYFSTFPDEKAYVYKNGKLDKLPETADVKAMLLGLDNDDNLFFSNSSGLFFHPKGGKQTVLLGDHTVNEFTLDSNRKLHFSTPTGMFSIAVTNGNAKITKLARITNIYGMVIESDGSFIYSSDNAIIRLKSTGLECSEVY